MIKKQTALITVLIMLFSAINVSFVYSAPVQSFYADFDEYSPGAFGKSAGKNGTGSKLYSSWFSIVNEANGNTTDSYINRTDNVTKTEFAPEETGGVSAKITVPSSEKSNVELHTVANLIADDEKVIHFAYDIKVGDKRGRTVWLYANGNSVKDYDFTRFETDGALKFNGTKLCTYEINTYYSFDVYYTVLTGKWEVYVNGVKRLDSVSKINGLTDISKLIFKLGGSGTQAVTYLDNICVEYDVLKGISFNEDFEKYPLGDVKPNRFSTSGHTYIEQTDSGNALRISHYNEDCKSSDNMVSLYNLGIRKETVFAFELKNRNHETGFVNVQLRSDDGNSPDSSKNIINLVSIKDGKITYLSDMQKLTESIGEDETAKITVVLNPVSGRLVVFNNGVIKRTVENIYSLNKGSWQAFDFEKTVFRFQTYVKATPEGEAEPYVTDILLDNIRVAEADEEIAFSETDLYYDGEAIPIDSLKNGFHTAKVSFANKSENEKDVFVFLAHKSKGKIKNLGFAKASAGFGEIKDIYCTVEATGVNGEDTLELTVADGKTLKPLKTEKLVYTKARIGTPLAQELRYMYEQKRQPHPGIIASKADFLGVKELSSSNETVKKWVESVIADADKMVLANISSPTSPYYIDYTLSSTGDILTMSRRVLSMVQTLGLAHNLSGALSSEYSEKAAEVLKKAADFPDWNPSHFLDTAEMMTAFAIGYDWMYDAFDSSTRKALETSVYEKGIIPAIDSYNGTGYANAGWWKNVDYNWNTVCNGAIAITCAAFADVYPDEAFELSAKAINYIKTALVPFAPDGAYEEGYIYAIYSLRYLSKLQPTLENVYGTDFGIMNNQGLKGIGDYLIAVDGPANANNYHDADEEGYHVDTSTLLWLADVYDKPDYSAFRIQNIEKYGYSVTPLDVIRYNPDFEESELSGAPLDAYFAGTEFVAMRSGYEDDSLYLSAHGGRANASHSHIDGGTFVLDMLGTRFANDLGAESYSADGYFGDKRYEYYRARAEGHNVFVINPDETPGQSTNCRLDFEKTSFGENPFAILDMTPAYKDYGIASAKRGYMLCDNRTSAVVRDEITLNSETDTVYWFMQTKADIKISGNTLTLTRNGKSIKLEFATNAPNAEVTYGNAEPLAQSNSQVTNLKNNGYKRIQIKMSGVKNLNITVKFTPSSGEYSAISSDSLSEWK